jgi:hypothetical protein
MASFYITYLNFIIKKDDVKFLGRTLSLDPSKNMVFAVMTHYNPVSAGNEEMFRRGGDSTHRKNTSLDASTHTSST